jgi:hypothetical protein
MQFWHTSECHSKVKECNSHSMTQLITLSQRERVKFVSEHHGLIARVARRCHVSNSLVSRVLRGTNTSKRVNTALDSEINKEIRKAQKQQERWAAKSVPDPGPEEAVA